MSENSGSNVCPKCHAPIAAEAPQGLCPKCVLAGVAEPIENPVAATSTAEIPTIERIAAAFPQLEILELIGRGGMGFVFKARQPHLDRFVALKLLPDKLARDPHFAERFNREGRVLAKLSHPNIVGVFDFGEVGGFYYLLMEYVDGVNLRQAMRAGRFSPMEALQIVPKICEALQYAHEQGVLHRDIKPENILLDAKGRVKIADFGIAKLVGEDAPSITLTGTGSALGTPHYMAPEQLEKPNQVDHRADIYSLGVVFYEMLTGELPIGRFAPPSERTPLDDRVDHIVMRALEKERELRQKNAGEFKTEVERVAADPHPPRLPNAPGHTPAAKPPVRWWHHFARGAVGGAVTFLLIFLGAVLVTRFLPRSYEAVARIGFAAPTPASEPQWVLGTGPDGLRSSTVLSNAAAELNLHHRWPSKFKGSVPPEEMERILRSGMAVHQVRSTRVYDVRYFSDNPEVAAAVANAIADAYCAAHKEASIVDTAAVPSSPIRPHLGVNAAIGAGIGLFLGALATFIFALDSWRRSRLDAKAFAAVGPSGTLVIDEKTASRAAANRSFAPWRVVPRWAFAVLLAIGLGLGVIAWFTTHEASSVYRTEYAQLARGVVDLTSVAPLSSDVAPWRPDGAPSADFVDAPTNAVRTQRGERAYQFLFRIKPPAPGISAPKFIISDSTAVTPAVEPTLNGEPVDGGVLVTASFPEGTKRTTIRAGIATDNWDTIARHAAQSRGSTTVTHGTQRVKLRLFPAQQESASMTVVSVVHNIRDLDYRIVARENDGREVPGVLSQVGRDQVTATFAGLPLSQIKEFQVQVRPYKWVEFRRVSLKPDAALASSVAPIAVRFRVAKGQVATFQLVRADVEPPHAVENLAGFFAASDEERTRGELRLIPDRSQGAKRSWHMELRTEEGAQAGTSGAVLGELLSSIQPPPDNFWEIRPNSEIGIMLTHPHPVGGDTTSKPQHVELRLVVRSMAYSNVVAGRREAPTVSAGTTNWMQSLRESTLAPKKQIDTSAWVRFTFTGVNVRRDSEGRWLAFEYLADKQGTVDQVFQWEQNIDGYKGKTRTSDFTRAADGRLVRHERSEFLMPPFVSEDYLRRWCEDLAKGTVGYSVQVYRDEQDSIFRLPVGTRGTLAAFVQAPRTVANP